MEGRRAYLSNMLNGIIAATALVHLVGRYEGNGCPGAPETADATDPLHVPLGVTQVEVDDDRGLEGERKGGREGEREEGEGGEMHLLEGAIDGYTSRKTNFQKRKRHSSPPTTYRLHVQATGQGIGADQHGLAPGLEVLDVNGVAGPWKEGGRAEGREGRGVVSHPFDLPYFCHFGYKEGSYTLCTPLPPSFLPSLLDFFPPSPPSYVPG